MQYMFQNAYVFAYDISSWSGTAAQTAQTSMFAGATAFNAKFQCTSDVNGPLSSCKGPSPIPDASLGTFVADCLAEVGASVTGECITWAQSNNVWYGTMPNWDVSEVTDMSYAFKSKTVFDGDISKWNTSKVTNMQYMFRLSESFNQPIGDWDTSKVTNMREMFSRAYAFNRDIGRWDTSQVTDMMWTFFNANSFNQDIGNWTTTSAKNMGYMFSQAHVFNQDIGRWDTSKVTNMQYMFQNAYVFAYDISSWTGTATTTAQTSMFEGATAFQDKFTCQDDVTGPVQSCFERLVNLETCSVLYEATSPTLPVLKAATADFPADHSTFNNNFAYYVYAEITTGSTYNTYEDVYLLGGTTACGSWFGGLYSGRPFIGTQCNWGQSTAVGLDETTATTALDPNQTYRIEWMYNAAEGYRRARIKVDGIVVLDSTTAYFNVDSSSTEEYLSIGSGYHTQASETMQGSVQKVSVHLCGDD